MCSKRPSKYLKCMFSLSPIYALSGAGYFCGVVLFFAHLCSYRFSFVFIFLFSPLQNRWAEMFPCMIARTSTTDVISSGMGGTRNGSLQLVSENVCLPQIVYKVF